MVQSNQCLTCAHYHLGWTCAAFPNGIPKAIANGSFDHRNPYMGDRGVRWEPEDKNSTRLVGDDDEDL